VVIGAEFVADDVGLYDGTLAWAVDTDDDIDDGRDRSVRILSP
jgi:hypothetical protein